MIVDIDEKSGFCFGVVGAITTAEKECNKGEIFSLGDIVHNSEEVKRLDSLGLKSITSSEFSLLKNHKVLIRAHGEPPETYIRAKENNIELIDATCPVVKRLQEKVVKAYSLMEAVNGQVVILGKKGHAEIIGLQGQIAHSIIVEDLADLELIDFSRPIYFLSQTTKSLDKFKLFAELLKERLSPSIHLTLGSDKPLFLIEDTICRQVSNREPHLIEFAKKYDLIIFIAGEKSSNGQVLYNVVKKSNPNTLFISKIESLKDDDISKAIFNSNINSIGICGATSTPKWLMNEAREYILSHS